MGGERAAYEYLHATRDDGFPSLEQRAHALRVRDLVASLGGLEGDRVIALLHEAPDFDCDLHSIVGDALSARIIKTSQSLPDFLRHPDEELMSRVESLLSSPPAARILWLCDAIDTFEKPMLRLSVESESTLTQALVDRCKWAQVTTQACANHPRFTAQVARARSAISDLAVRVRAGLVSAPARSADPGGVDFSPGD